MSDILCHISSVKYPPVCSVRYVHLLPPDTMAELAAYPTPVSSFRLKSLSKLQNIFTHRYFYSDTFFLLANQSLDPSLQKIASDYIVHYDYDEVDCALSPWSSLSIKISEFEEKKCDFQALDNVTNSKVVMAEARMMLDFFSRKMFTNKFGESSMHIMKVRACKHFSFLRSASFLLVWLMLCKRTRPLQRGSPYYAFAFNHSENSNLTTGSAAKFSNWRSPALSAFGSDKSWTWWPRVWMEVLSFEHLFKEASGQIDPKY